MTQGDVNTSIYRLDYELMYCMKLLHILFPEYVKAYIDSICMSILRTGHKRYTYYDTPDKSIGKYFLNRDIKDSDKFIELLKELRLFRNEYYVFISNTLNIIDENRFTIEGSYYLRSFFKVDEIKIGNIIELDNHFKLAVKILEVVEESFYKKVISSAIAFSNGNPDFVQDNFMEGSEGLRNAIMRFSIYNGGILAAYFGQWVQNKMIAFRAPDIVSGIPSDIRSTYEKLKEEMKKRNTTSVEDVAHRLRMTVEKAKDVERVCTKEPDIRIDIATQGVEDDDAEVPDFLIEKKEDEVESIQYLFEGIGDLERKCMCIEFGNFEDYPNNELTDEEIQKEIEYQNS